MSERGYVDLAAFAGDHYDDAWVAMAESYAEVAATLNAVLLRKGPLVVREDEITRAFDFVTTIDPVESGGVFVGRRLMTVPRGEVPLADPGAVDRLRAKWERTYVRREP